MRKTASTKTMEATPSIRPLSTWMPDTTRKADAMPDSITSASCLRVEDLIEMSPFGWIFVRCSKYTTPAAKKQQRSREQVPNAAEPAPIIAQKAERCERGPGFAV